MLQLGYGLGAAVDLLGVTAAGSGGGSEAEDSEQEAGYLPTQPLHELQPTQQLQPDPACGPGELLAFSFGRAQHSPERMAPAVSLHAMVPCM